MTGYFSDAGSFWNSSISDILCILHGKSEQERRYTQMENIRAGNLLAMLVNIKTPAGSRRLTWTDFYRDLSEPAAEQSPEEIAGKLRAAFGYGRCADAD